MVKIVFFCILNFLSSAQKSLVSAPLGFRYPLNSTFIFLPFFAVNLIDVLYTNSLSYVAERFASFYSLPT